MDTSSSIHTQTRLREERMRRNWRQCDVAEQIGVTVVTIKRWEGGSQQPGAYFRARLCALFDKTAEELGLIENIPSPPVSIDRALSGERQESPSLAEVRTLWTVPYLRNPHFTGRSEILDQIDRHFSIEEPGAPTTIPRVVLQQPLAIKGISGIGKTQIVVEYAYRVREQGRYTHILWVHAANEEKILSSFSALAKLPPLSSAKEEKDQHELAAEMKHWLEQCQQPWLLIFDNANDLFLAQEYFPHQGTGNILLTTRVNAAAAVAASIEVEKMGLMEGTRFLLHRAQRHHVSDEKINEAMNITITLDGFPLALEQAGAYIEGTRCGFRDYLQIYQEQHQALLTWHKKQVSSYTDTVATTQSLLLLLQKVEQANPAAADLLRLCAFLAPDRIPEELFFQGTLYWTPALQRATSNLFTFNQMLETLLTFSLIKRCPENRLLSIHRLLQTVQLDAIKPEEQRQWAERVIHAMNVIFPHDPKKDAAWLLCQRYLEQAQSCATLIQQHLLTCSEAADLLNRTSIYLHECGLDSLANRLYLRALAIHKMEAGPERPETVLSDK